MIVGLGDLGCADCRGKCGGMGALSINDLHTLVGNANTAQANAEQIGDFVEAARQNALANGYQSQLNALYAVVPPAKQADVTAVLASSAPVHTCPTGFMWDGIAGLRGLAGCVKTPATLAAEAAALKATQDAALAEQARQAAIVAARTCPTGFQWDGIDGLRGMGGCIPIPVTPSTSLPPLTSSTQDQIPGHDPVTQAASTFLSQSLFGIPVWALAGIGVVGIFAWGNK